MPSVTLSLLTTDDNGSDNAGVWTSEACNVTTTRTIGFSFVSTLAIPAGATISAAYLRLYCDHDDSGGMTLDIKIEDADPATNTRWQTGHLPSGGTFYTPTSTGSFNSSTGQLYFGEGNNAATNIAAQLQALLNEYGKIEVGQRINIALAYTAGSGEVGFEALGDAGSNDATFSISWVAPTYVERTEGATASGTDSCTTSITVTAGNTLVAIMTAIGDTYPTLGTCSDNGGGTWELVGAVDEPATGDSASRHPEMWICHDHPGGTVTVTWAKPAGLSGNGRVTVFEVTPCQVADWAINDVQNPGTGANAVASDVLDIGDAPGALIIGVNYHGPGLAAAAGTGFTDAGSFILGFGRAEYAYVSVDTAVGFTTDTGTRDFIVWGIALVPLADSVVVDLVPRQLGQRFFFRGVRP